MCGRRFLGGAAFRKAARIGGRFDRIVVHFQPALYYRPRAAPSKVVTSLCLLWLVLRRPRVNLVVHEADRPVRWRPDYVILGLAFRAAGTVSFHTRAEQSRPGARLPGPGARRADPAPGSPGGAGGPGRGPGRPGDPDGRRAGVRVPRVPPAFEGHRAGGGRVRRPRREGACCTWWGRSGTHRPRADAYLRGLRELCERTPGVTLVERWLDDEEFDRWIRAADAVVLPYRRAWSSGVLARAHALGTPAVVADVGGLAEQAGDRDVVVESDADLAAAMARPDFGGAHEGSKRSNAPAIAGGAVNRTEHAHEWDPFYAPEPNEPTRKGHLMLLGLILFSVVLAALAQLTLKHGMNQVSDYGARPLELGQPLATLERIASNVSVWIGLATFAASALVWLVVLSRASLSFAYPFAVAHLRADPAVRPVRAARRGPAHAVGRRGAHHRRHPPRLPHAAQLMADLAHPPDLAVVVVNLDTGPYLTRCVRSAFENAGDASLEVVVVDNDSHDGSADAAVAANPGTVLIQNGSNRGFAAAANQGMRATTAPFVLLLNPDAEILAGTLGGFVKVAAGPAPNGDRRRARPRPGRVDLSVRTHGPDARRWPSATRSSHPFRPENR